MSDEQDHARRANLVDRNEDGSLTKETIKRAMKAFRKRLKLMRLDDESRLGHDPLSKGVKSTIIGIRPPEQYPPDVWDTGSWKSSCSPGTHGPRYRVTGPMSRCNSLYHARAKASASSSGFS